MIKTSWSVFIGLGIATEHYAAAALCNRLSSGGVELVHVDSVSKPTSECCWNSDS